MKPGLLPPGELALHLDCLGDDPIPEDQTVLI